MPDQEVPEFNASRDQHAWRTRFYTRLQRFRTLVLSRWWVAAIAIVLGLLVEGTLWVVQKPEYVSTGRMIVNVRLTIPEGSLYTEELSNFIGTQSAMMQSGIVINRAQTRLISQLTNAAPERVDLKVTVLPKTTIFVLQATGGKQDYTRAFLQACMEEYINLKKEMRIQTSDSTLAGLTEEVLKLQKDLKKADADLASFQSSNSVVLLQEQGNTAASYLATLNQKLAGLRSEYALLQSLTLEQNLERKQQGSSPLPTANELVSAGANSNASTDQKTDYFRAKQQIALLKAEEQDMSQYLKPKHPRMIALADEIQRRERLLDIYKQQSAEQVQSLKNSLQLQIARMEKDVQEWDAKSLEVSRKNAEYQRLKAESQRVQALYDRLLGMMQSLDVNKDISPESVTIMEPASIALPQRQELWIKLAIGFGAGLALGIMLLIFIDRMDDRMSSFNELQDLFDEAVLAQIPREKAAVARKSGPLVTHPDAPHSFVEAYRNLRSSLLYMAESGAAPKTLLVTSSVPSEGKSLTSANLSATVAISGAKVLLIDGDMRKGLLHDEFGIHPEPGLSEVLSGKIPISEAIRTTSIPNLSVLPRGAFTQRGSEMFVSTITRDLLKKVSAEYDFVVLDTAPVMAADDVTSLAPHVDATLFVVRAESTSARIARAALDLLYQRRVNVVGLVFNSVRPNAVDYYYYKYRDYYASYPDGSSGRKSSKK